MPDDIFNKILSELSEIQYDGEICLSYFNEPLLCTKIFNRIEQLRRNLPNSFIYLFTNGEFLVKKHFQLLPDAGLDLLLIDIYTDEKEMSYNPHAAHKVAKSLIERIGLPLNITPESEHINVYCKYDNMDIEIITRDFNTFASNRAESLSSDLPIPKICGHPLLCIKNFISYHIDYSGGVYPCPNYHRDFEKHREFCLGNVLEESIYDIYIGKKMSDYRERHFFHRDTLPCRSCIWNFYSFITNRFYRPFRDRPKTRR